MEPAHGLIVLLLAFLPLTVCGAAEGPPKKVDVFRDPALAPVEFAAGELAGALRAKGFAAALRPLTDLPAAAGPRIVLTVAGRPGAPAPPAGAPALKAQGFAILPAKNGAWWAIGADPAGAMYAGLHLAEAVRLGGGPGAVAEVVRGPAIARRGIKFNIPLDARTPSYDDTGDAAQLNIAEMWDPNFWTEFLDDLARCRYNTLTLWNPHPFPSIVKLPNHPDVALDDVCVTKLPPTDKTHREWLGSPARRPENLRVVRKMTIDEKIGFWRRVMQHAADRCIDVYFITWNVFVDGAEGKYGITAAQDNPATIAYLRESVCRTILTYPLLAGIGTTAGERMRNRTDEFAKEKWLWRTYGLGVQDARRAQPGRRVRFIHRFWQSGVGPIVDDFGTPYGEDFELSFKYARAHMYSSTRPPFADELCKDLQRLGLKCWWNLRNDDIFNFRWGDPDYVRQFLGNLPAADVTAGYHMGSDGYVWGREFTSLQPDQPRQLEIRKHWYRFLLWGRLGYEPGLDRAFFERLLADRFPSAAPAALYDAWQQASRIIPLVNRFHWRNWDFQWAVEGCMDEKGFHTVDDFIRVGPMADSGLVSVGDHVRQGLAGKTPEGTAPPQVADQLDAHARAAIETLAGLRAAADRDDKQLRATLDDIEAMAHLGRYYAAKIRGAVELCAFRTSKAPARKQAAIDHLTAAVEHWTSYAALAARNYRPQLLARTRQLDWLRTLQDVKKDVDIARAAN